MCAPKSRISENPRNVHQSHLITEMNQIVGFRLDEMSVNKTNRNLKESNVIQRAHVELHDHDPSNLFKSYNSVAVRNLDVAN